MLTYRDIINAFTKKISKAFLNVDIYTDDTVNGVDGACFYVQLIPGKSFAITKETNINNIMVSVKYYGDKETKKLDILDISNSLSNEFNRIIKVKERHLNIDNVEADVLKDEVGYYLEFLVTISYADEIGKSVSDDKEEDYKIMQDVKINIKR